MIAWRSLEVRLALWYSVLLFAGYLALSVALWLGVRYAVTAAVDRLLDQRLTHLVEFVTEQADPEDLDEDDEDLGLEIQEDLIEYVSGVPEGGLTQVRDAAGTQIFPPDPAWPTPVAWTAPGGGGASDTIDVDGVPHRLLVAEVTLLDRPYTVLQASSLESLTVIRNRVVLSLLLATPIALLLCGGGGYYTARRALRPVERITETAAAITVSKLSSRLEVPDTGDTLERLARTLNAMLERLEASVTRIEQFSGDASHELRTPLAVIRTTVELALRHGRTEAESREDFQAIQAEAVRLTELIEVLLELSRAGVDGATVAMEGIDLAAVAGAVHRQFEPSAAAKGLELTLSAPLRPVMVRGNEAALRRMTASLVENALAHTAAGVVTLTVTDDDDGMRLVVRDTGEGIPADELDRVFDRFYRVDRSRSEAGTRLGLGLSIVRRIAELHRATVTVESRLGEGAAFTVRFHETFGHHDVMTSSCLHVAGAETDHCLPGHGSSPRTATQVD